MATLIGVFKLVTQRQLAAEIFFMKKHRKNKVNFTFFR